MNMMGNTVWDLLVSKTHQQSNTLEKNTLKHRSWAPNSTPKSTTTKHRSWAPNSETVCNFLQLQQISNVCNTTAKIQNSFAFKTENIFLQLCTIWNNGLIGYSLSSLWSELYACIIQIQITFAQILFAFSFCNLVCTLFNCREFILIPNQMDLINDLSVE